MLLHYALSNDCANGQNAAYWSAYWLFCVKNGLLLAA
jgi:hypothetical protein